MSKLINETSQVFIVHLIHMLDCNRDPAILLQSNIGPQTHPETAQSQKFYALKEAQALCLNITHMPK